MRIIADLPDGRRLVIQWGWPDWGHPRHRGYLDGRPICAQLDGRDVPAEDLAAVTQPFLVRAYGRLPNGGVRTRRPRRLKRDIDATGLGERQYNE